MAAPYRSFPILLKSIFIVSLVVNQEVRSAPPPELPGEEITTEIFKQMIPRDTIGAQRVTPLQRDSLAWYDRAAKTWEAPPLFEQMASEKANIPMGMGGIFVPRFTQANDEPDVEIVKLDGAPVKSGEPGRTFSVEPGRYYVLIGSGSHKQRMVRQVEVTESKTTPVLPDWSGLTIETVDSAANIFRGEYELVRIDEFEPYGRGFGADQELGEKVKTWVLRPGIYKILGRGEGYNTLRNFITVRLLPGELVNVVLIQRPADMAIISGGTIDVFPGKRIASNWKYGVNIGGNIQLTGEIDRKVKKEALISVLSLRTTVWLRYHRNPFEWENSLLLDEGINLAETDFEDLVTAPDDFRIISLFIYRFFSRVGPYIRNELRTNLLPNRLRLDETSKEFCIVSKDSTEYRFESGESFEYKPSLCPFKFDLDIGANIDIFNLGFLELRLRGGVGSSLNDFPSRYEISALEGIRYVIPSDSARLKNSMILSALEAVRTFEFGPQGSATGNLRIGRMGTAGCDLRVFFPVAPEMRVDRPDFDVTATISWRLSRAVTLDYDYTYTIKQPPERSTQVNFSTHKIYLRFSYSNR